MGATRGFDAFVGNPPFAGKNTLLAAEGERYPEWLKASHEESHGNSDVVAHFFRRAFDLLRPGGTFGLLATNTIAQGDTRGTGLRWICKHGGVIYAAIRRYKWPGIAAVVVSIVHVQRAPAQPVTPRLDGKPVDRISAFLFHQGGDDDPIVLAANANRSFQGSIVLGMGFTFDDTKPEATSLAEMQRIVARDPRNADRIFPYLGSDEVNSNPTHSTHRYVINFGNLPEEEARSWPDLFSIVERKVKPQRLSDNRPAYRRNWWQFAEKRVELFAAVKKFDRMMAAGRTSEHLSFVFLPTNYVPSENLVVFALNVDAFPILQGRVHSIWVGFTSSTLEDRQGYRSTDCFETFPFPRNHAASALAAIGNRYYEFRATLMVKSNEGLTDTYNRFHDPDEHSSEILELRRLHDEMDRAVLDAYGWTDVHPTCEFLLAYAVGNESEEGSGRARKKKKPWRYRWPDELRDEVLARLLALNAERAAEEKRAGEEAKLEAEQAPALPVAQPKRSRSTKRDAGPKLPGVE